MSKKRGNKKNQDLDDEFDDKKNLNESQDITSKSKGKGKKKGKGKDLSDDEEVKKKPQISDEEEEVKPVKKSQKKGLFLNELLTKFDENVTRICLL